MNNPGARRRSGEYYAGCLLGGAVGDALGAPVEFSSLSRIRGLFTQPGLMQYPELNEQGLAEFTDDTQMTLFTAEGLLRARSAGALDRTTTEIYQAYLRWLQTQRAHQAPAGEGLVANPELWHIKAPGNTCLSALGRGRMGTPENPINNSKGCGGVMRAAPVGLVFCGERAFIEGARSAAITHGHPSGYLSAGLLAQAIAEIIAAGPSATDPKTTLLEAVQAGLRTLRQWSGHAETASAVERALEMAADPRVAPLPETVETIGGGWVGEEALAVAVYCALVHVDDFGAALRLSVVHSGDSDSTGSICGNLLGALHGISAIPAPWLDSLQMRPEIERIAHALL